MNRNPAWVRRRSSRLSSSVSSRHPSADYRLTDEQIPLEARIISVCDAYHAMTRERPHRAAVGHNEAVDELRRCAGGQFDPAVVEAFVRAFAVTPPAERLLEPLDGEDPTAPAAAAAV